MYYKVWSRNFILCWNTRETLESKFKMTYVQLEYGFLSLVSTKSLYKHFPSKHDQIERCIKKNLISNMVC